MPVSGKKTLDSIADSLLQAPSGNSLDNIADDLLKKKEEPQQEFQLPLFLKGVLGGGAETFSSKSQSQSDGLRPPAITPELQKKIDEENIQRRIRESKQTKGLFDLPDDISAIEDYNKQFEDFTGHSSRKLFDIDKPDSDKLLSTGFGEKKYKERQLEKFTEYKQAEEDISSVLGNVEYGMVKPGEIKRLDEKPYGKKIVRQLYNHFGGKDEQELTFNILVKNRGKGVAEIERQNTELDNEINSAADKYESVRWESTSAGVGSFANQRKVVNPIEKIDPNSKTSISEAISKIERSHGLTDKETGSDNPELKIKLLESLNNKLSVLIGQTGVEPEIAEVLPAIEKHVGEISSRAYYGMMKPGQNPNAYAASLDKKKSEHFALGLSHLKYSNPAWYSKVYDVIKSGEGIPEGDFRDISGMGQRIMNDKIFIESKDNPAKIGAETDIDYRTFDDVLEEYRTIIGERKKAKEAGIGNYGLLTPLAAGVKDVMKTGTMSRSEIMELGDDLENKNVLSYLAYQEKRTSGNAIPKSGATAALKRGALKPFQGIESTILNLGESPAETYLRESKGHAGREPLPSDKENIYYKIIEGASNFVVQALLTRGFGNPVAATAGAATSVIPRAALTAKQLNNVSTLSGTFLSSVFQSFGDNWIDSYNKTGDANLSTLMASITAGAAGAFEAGILPDVKIADNFVNALRGKSDDLIRMFEKNKGLSLDMLRHETGTFLKRLWNNSVDAAKGAGKVIWSEELEEIGTNTVDFITESVFSPRTAVNRDFAKETVNIIKETALATAFPALLGAATSVINRSVITREALNDAAMNFEDSKDRLQKAVFRGRVSPQQYLNAMDLLEIHKRNIEEQSKDGEIPDQKGFDKAFDKTAKTVKSVVSQDIKEDEKSNDEKLLEKLYVNASDIEKEEGLNYFIDKSAEDPIEFETRFGGALTKAVIEKAPTEKLIQSRDKLVKNNVQPHVVDYLNDVIAERQAAASKTEPSTVSGVEGGDVVDFTAKSGNKVVDEKGDPLTVYHGTNKEFEKLDVSKPQRGLFFAKDKSTAESYANTNDKKGKVVEANINLKNPHIIDAKGSTFDKISVDLNKAGEDGKGVSKDMSVDEIVEALRGMRSEDIVTNLYGTKTKADGIIIKNVRDKLSNQSEPTDIYIPFSNEQISEKQQPKDQSISSNTPLKEQSTKVEEQGGEAKATDVGGEEKSSPFTDNEISSLVTQPLTSDNVKEKMSPTEAIDVATGQVINDRGKPARNKTAQTFMIQRNNRLDKLLTCINNLK